MCLGGLPEDCCRCGDHFVHLIWCRTSACRGPDGQACPCRCLHSLLGWASVAPVQRTHLPFPVAELCHPGQLRLRGGGRGDCCQCQALAGRGQQKRQRPHPWVRGLSPHPTVCVADALVLEQPSLAASRQSPGCCMMQACCMKQATGGTVLLDVVYSLILLRASSRLQESCVRQKSKEADCST